LKHGIIALFVKKRTYDNYISRFLFDIQAKKNVTFIATVIVTKNQTNNLLVVNKFLFLIVTFNITSKFLNLSLKIAFVSVFSNFPMLFFRRKIYKMIVFSLKKKTHFPHCFDQHRLTGKKRSRIRIFSICAIGQTLVNNTFIEFL